MTYKASSRSIELALGSAPQNRDPYRLPPSAAEQAQRTPFEQSRTLVRDPTSGQWQQEITDLHDGRLQLTRHAAVTAERTAQLEQQSQAIIAANAAQTPAAMATRFRNAYETNGWHAHGPLPAAVHEAMANPGRVVGSDGNRYERGADGQWTHDGLLWDSRADGRLHHELEATYQQQQRSLGIKTLETVTVRPGPDVSRDQAPTVVPPGPADAPARTADPASTRAAPRSPDDEGHPDRGMLVRIRAGVALFDQAAGKPWDQVSERLSRAMLAACKADEREYLDKHGETSVAGNALQRVDHLAMSPDGRRMFAIQGEQGNPAHLMAMVEVDRAIRTPVDVSDAHLAQANAQIAEELARARQQELARNQAPDDPIRSGPTR